MGDQWYWNDRDQLEYEWINNQLDQDQAIYQFRDYTNNSISLTVGQTEMIKITEDGFYVRGLKVETDDKEAKRVYNAFKQFLVWAELNRR